MKKIMLIALVAIFAACRNDGNNYDANMTDINFTMNAAMSNNAVISSGNLAVSKGSTAGITGFAQEAVNDHSAANNKLRSLAKGLELYAPDSLDATGIALVAQLSVLSGKQFDSAYLQSQVTAYTQAIAMFQDEVSNGINTRLKNFASDQLPKLQAHLETIQKLSAGN